MQLLHALSFLGGATLALSAAAPEVRPPINTPAPMQPGAYEHCEQFYLASPGVTCHDIAAAHRLALDVFIALNPQVPAAGGCAGGAIIPHHWYCVRGDPRELVVVPNVDDDGNIIEPPTHRNGAAPTPSRGNGGNAQNPSPGTTERPTPTTTRTTRTTTYYPTITCSADDCWRAFKLAVGGARRSQRAWCSQFMTTPCTARAMESLAGVPNLVSMQCTQAPPCEAVYSGCGCYLAGHMGPPRTWDP